MIHQEDGDLGKICRISQHKVPVDTKSLQFSCCLSLCGATHCQAFALIISKVSFQMI